MYQECHPAITAKGIVLDSRTSLLPPIEGPARSIRTYYDDLASEVESHFSRALQRHVVGTTGTGGATLRDSLYSPMSAFSDSCFETEGSGKINVQHKTETPLSYSTPSLMEEEKNLRILPGVPGPLTPTLPPPLSSPCTTTRLNSKIQEPQFIKQLQFSSLDCMALMELPRVPGESPDFGVTMSTGEDGDIRRNLDLPAPMQYSKGEYTYPAQTFQS